MCVYSLFLGQYDQFFVLHAIKSIPTDTFCQAHKSNGRCRNEWGGNLGKKVTSLARHLPFALDISQQDLFSNV